jgi:hypothetical protein
VLPRAETEITAQEAWADENHEIYVAVDAFRGCQCDSTVCEGFESGKDVNLCVLEGIGIKDIHLAS